MKRVYVFVVLAALLVLAASMAFAQRDARPDKATAPQLTPEDEAVVQQLQDLRKQLRIDRLELALAEAKEAPLSEIAERAEQVYRIEGQLYALRVKNPQLAAQRRQGPGGGRGPGGPVGMGPGGRHGMGGPGMGRRGRGMGNPGWGMCAPQCPGAGGPSWCPQGPGERGGVGGRGMGRHRGQGMGGRGPGPGDGMDRGRGMGFGPQGPGGPPPGRAWRQSAPGEMPMPAEPEPMPQVD